MQFFVSKLRKITVIYFLYQGIETRLNPVCKIVLMMNRNIIEIKNKLSQGYFLNTAIDKAIKN